MYLCFCDVNSFFSIAKIYARHFLQCTQYLVVTSFFIPKKIFGTNSIIVFRAMLRNPKNHGPLNVYIVEKEVYQFKKINGYINE